MQSTSSVTQKGQVTIPRHIRKALNIDAKDLVEFTLVDGEVRLRPIKSAVLASYGAIASLKSRERPIDFRQLRSEVEEEIADEAASEG